MCLTLTSTRLNPDPDDRFEGSRPSNARSGPTGVPPEVWNDTSTFSRLVVEHDESGHERDKKDDIELSFPCKEE